MPSDDRYSAAGVPFEIAPIGEMWSVVSMSPNIPSTRAPRMSAGAAGFASMSSKNGGRRMNVLPATRRRWCRVCPSAPAIPACPRAIVA